MKRKAFTIGITFYITPEMNEKINTEANVLQISKSEYIRKSIELFQNNNSTNSFSKEQNDHEQSSK